MNDAKKNLYEYLNRLYAPKAKKPIIENLRKYIEVSGLRYISQDDADTKRRVLLIHSKGKGARETFESFEVKYIDFDSRIGQKYCYSFIHDQDGSGYLKRLDITSVKNLIII